MRKSKYNLFKWSVYDSITFKKKVNIISYTITEYVIGCRLNIIFNGEKSLINLKPFSCGPPLRRSNGHTYTNTTHTHTHTYTHTHTHTHKHTHTYIHPHTHTRTHAHTHKHTCIRIHSRAQTRIHIRGERDSCF